LGVNIGENERNRRIAPRLPGADWGKKKGRGKGNREKKNVRKQRILRGRCRCWAETTRTSRQFIHAFDSAGQRGVGPSSPRKRWVRKTKEKIRRGQTSPYLAALYEERNKLRAIDRRGPNRTWCMREFAGQKGKKASV